MLEIERASGFLWAVKRKSGSNPQITFYLTNPKKWRVLLKKEV